LTARNLQAAANGQLADAGWMGVPAPRLPTGEFGPEHLTNSLQHLAELAAPASRA